MHKPFNEGRSNNINLLCNLWIEFIAESRNPRKSLPWILEGMVSSAPCICLCSYAAPGPTAAVTNRCNYTGSRVQCPPAAGAGAVAQFGGVSAAPSPQPSPAQPSCPLLPVEEGDIDMIAIYRWTWSCLISTVDIYYLLLCVTLSI